MGDRGAHRVFTIGLASCEAQEALYQVGGVDIRDLSDCGRVKLGFRDIGFRSVRHRRTNA